MGYLRLSLALVVMASHIGPPGSAIAQLRLAPRAVWLFYVLAGYFAVLQTQGQYRGQRWAFLANRALRIYPVYWVVLVAFVAWMWFFAGPDFYAEWVPRPAIPLRNALLLIPLDGVLYGVPVHVAWTLTVMLYWWAAIAFGIFDSRRQTFALLAVAILAQSVFRPAYISLQWAAVPFAVGAALYWAGAMVQRERGLSAIAGALSYPVFLVHYPVGAVLGYSLGWERSWPLFWAALLPTMALSLLLWRCVEVPVDRYRRRLRG